MVGFKNMSKDSGIAAVSRETPMTMDLIPHSLVDPAGSGSAVAAAFDFEQVRCLFLGFATTFASVVPVFVTISPFEYRTNDSSDASSRLGIRTTTCVQ